MMMMRNDLRIIGAGELGSRVGRLWRKWIPESQITAETATVVRHATLQHLGLLPSLRSHRGEETASHILFSLPPSSSKRYLGEVEDALRLWNHLGRFIFISSTGVYRENQGGEIREDSPLAGTERASRLIEAEEAVIRNDGIVVRLAGLYCLKRGPHRSFLTTGESPLNAEGYINLIHYEDAALLVRMAFEKGIPKSIYLGSDGNPITRRELADLAQTHFASSRSIVFLAKEKSMGKKSNNELTRTLLGWSPLYPSFESYLKSFATIPEDIA